MDIRRPVGPVMLRLHTLGTVHLTRNGEVLSGPAGQRRLLAILTILAVVGERGASRDKVLGLLWSEGDPDKSRHALTQSLYHIRKALGGERIFLSGSDLRLDPALFSSDIVDFQTAMAERRYADATALYAGSFLDGFHLSGNPEFDFWVSAERDKYSRQFSQAVSALADAAAAGKDSTAELRWLARLADHAPLDGAVIAKYMRALIAAGDHSTALQRAHTYRARLREDLDLPPDRAVVDLVTELRRAANSRAQSVEMPSAEEVSNLAADQPAPIEQAHAPAEAPPAPKRRARMWRAAAFLSVAATVAFAAIVTRVAASRAAGRRLAEREKTVMIAPFRVASSEPASAYLREGLLDLLSSRLSEPEAKRAIDPALVLQAWKRAGYGPDSAVPVATAARLARELDAAEIVIGSVVSSGADAVKIHASLVDAANARVKADVNVTGSPDSLMALTDRLVNGLILTEAGERIGTFAQMSVAPQALRAFLAGRAAYRRADYYGAIRAYEAALAQEPTFARAALGLAMSADHVNAAEQHDRGLAIAWARQRDLPVGDREYLYAFAGPRYPEPSSAGELLNAWERAVRVAPDRPEGWQALGESFYYDGEMIGLHDGLSRASDAFRHALRIDPTYAPSRRLLTLLLARTGDTTELRAMVAGGIRTADDSMSVFVRWRAAQALKDSRELARVRRAFDDAPSAALRSIAMTSQFDGVSIDDGDRALGILGKRPLSDAEEIDLALANHSRALNAADPARAFGITEEMGRRQPGLHPHLRLRVLDGLYADATRAGVTAAAARLEAIVAASAPRTLADSAVRLADMCVLGQWRLAARDTVGARAAVRALRAGVAARFPVPVGGSPMMCAELIDVSLAVAERGAGARDRLAHLDSLMLGGPAVSDATRYANLIVARHYQALGDPAHGLAALRRRSFMRGWPRYRATGLQLQIDLATQMGDTAAARAAYQRLMSTRRHPIVAESPPPFVSRLRRLSHRLVE